MDLLLTGRMSDGKSAKQGVLEKATITSKDESIVKVINNTKLIGLKNGTTSVEVQLGEFKKEVEITVEDKGNDVIFLEASQPSVVVNKGEDIQINF